MQKKRPYKHKPNPLNHHLPISSILLTNAEAAAFLRICPRMLKYHRDLKLIPFVKNTTKGRVYFYQTDLEQYLLANRHVGKLGAA